MPERLSGDVIGVIDPRNLYDTQAVMKHAGIGEVRLREERKAGRITVHKDSSGRQWYRGEDLIALITSANGASP